MWLTTRMKMWMRVKIRMIKMTRMRQGIRISEYSLNMNVSETTILTNKNKDKDEDKNGRA